MINIKGILSYFWRFKWLIFLIPLISISVTYYFVRDMPKQYRSQAIIGADSEVSQRLLSNDSDRYGMWQQLNRVTEMLRMKRELDLLSYHLIIHDLEYPEAAFREYSETINKLSAPVRDSILNAYKTKLRDQTLLTLRDNEKYPLLDIVSSMGYDDKRLTKKLTLSIKEALNYIDIGFESENPELSVYVVNTLSSNFINRFNSASSFESQRSLGVLDSILQAKESVMKQRNAQLAGYLSNIGVGSSGRQSDVLYQQILTYEDRESNVRREIASLKGAIASINGKLENPNDRDLGTTATSTSNNEILNIEGQLQRANQQYIDNGFRTADKRIVDSLQQRRSALVAASSSGQGRSNSQANRQSLVSERMRLETQLALAENSISSIQSQIKSLRDRYSSMIPTDASTQNLSREAEIATKDYEDALDRFNQASLINYTSGLSLSMVELGIPSQGEGSQRVLYIVLSAMASSTLCFSVLLIAFFIDKRIFTPQQLAESTQSNVIASLNLITQDDKDLRNIWADEGTIAGYNVYKDCIRSLRFELNKELTDNDKKVLGITSLRFGEGKTFVASSLAYSFALIGKKVLLICEDARDLTTLITNKEAKNEQSFESFLVKKEIMAEDRITILTKSTSGNSLLELKDAKSLFAGFELLKTQFDIIIIDIDCLQDLHKVKEWLMFTDKCIAVFQAGNAVDEHAQPFVKYLREHDGFLGFVMNRIKIA